MEGAKACLSCGRESPPFSSACIWCGAPFPAFGRAARAPAPVEAREPAPLAEPTVAEVPAPPPLRLARAGGGLGIAAGGLSIAFAGLFLSVAPLAAAAVFALGLLGVVSGALAVRRRHWRPSLVFGALGALAGAVTVIGLLLATVSLALLAAARDEFLS